MAFYLLDTNHLSKSLDRVSPVRDRIMRCCASGDRFTTCDSVLCELEVGIQQTVHTQRNRLELRRILKHVRIRQLTRQTTEDFGEISLKLKNAGRNLSHTDRILAALARRHSLTLLSTDRDFEALPDLTVEDWCAA